MNNMCKTQVFTAPFIQYIDFDDKKQRYYDMYKDTDTYRFIAFTNIFPSQCCYFGMMHTTNNKPFKQNTQRE
jgi:hypothetical protein